MAASVFDRGVATFFRGLARDNSRDWFAAHRDDYDRLVRGPLEQLAAEAGERYGESRVFRPHRDVRFSADKSPYKTNGAMWAGEVGGIYLQVDAHGVMVGGGMYEPTRDQLQRGRAAIDGVPRAAADLGGIVDRLEKAGFEFAGPPLKTAPRGYPKDHPQIELLRMTHYAALKTLPLDADRAAIRAAWRATEPLIEWTREYIGPAEEERPEPGRR